MVSMYLLTFLNKKTPAYSSHQLRSITAYSIRQACIKIQCELSQFLHKTPQNISNRIFLKYI